MHSHLKSGNETKLNNTRAGNAHARILVEIFENML